MKTSMKISKGDCSAARRMTRRSLLTVIIAALCAVIIACSASLLSGIAPKALSSTNAASAHSVAELTVSNYDSSQNKVFDGASMSQLYDELTNTSDGSATIHKVEKMLDDHGHSDYVSETIAKYMNAKDLKDKNGYNIVVNFGGMAWDVVFLTRDKNNNLILTLWLDQPLNSGQTFKFGWTTTSATANITAGSTARIANGYSASQLRALGLNGGASSGSSTYYTGSGSSGVHSGTQTVSVADRKAHSLANFTLDNGTLGNNKSLINYLVQPKDVDYTYKLAYKYLDGSNYSHILNEALTDPLMIQNTQGGSSTTFYSTGAHSGGWWNAGVKNYAVTNAASNGYNDWGSDYVWAPALTETGYNGSLSTGGLWGTTTDKGGAGQNQWGAANVGAPSSALAATTNSSNYVWLRSGAGGNPYRSQFLSSSGGGDGACSAASLAVRPALHLNLTSAASAAGGADTIEVPVPTSISENYDGNVQTLATWAALPAAAGSSDPKYKWIDLAYHNDTSIVSVSKIEYKKYSSSGSLDSTYTTLAAGSSIQHAGEYKITYKIDTASTKYRWHGENASVTEKSLIVTIKQLNMTYDWKFYDQSNTDQTATKKAPYTGGTVSADFVPTGTPISGSNMATFAIYHKGGTFGVTDNGGLGSTTGPTDAGTYTATYKDTSTTGTDYKIVSTATSLSYQITKKQVQLPTASGTFTYDGTTQTISFPTSGATAFDTNILKVKSIKVTSPDGSSINVSQVSGQDKWETSDHKYTAEISGSNLLVKDAATYAVEFDLKDTTNTEWATGVASNHSTSVTVDRAALSVTFSTPGTGFTWKMGDTGTINVSAINTIFNSENVTVELEWYKDGAPAAKTSMHTTGVPDTTGYNVSGITAAGTYWICARLANDSTGDDVNRNYYIDATDPNTSDPETATQKVIVQAGTATMDNVKWQYKTPSMVTGADVTGATITYDKTSTGTAVTYTLEVTGFAPASCTAVYSGDFAKSAAGNYTAKVKLEIPTADRGNSKMPNPGDAANPYTYAGEGRYTYINDYTCEIEFDWTIDQKEVDLSNVSFEYSTDNGTTWTKYDATKPPEADGFSLFQVRVPATAIANSGILSATPSNYVNQFGPGDVEFEFAFTLDSNYKAKAGQNQSAMQYKMATTGKKIEIVWKRVPLKDASGTDVVDANGIPYYVYELDTSNIPSSVLGYIKYEYYEVSGGVQGSIISGNAVGNHQGLGYVIDPTGMNANSQNPQQVFVRVVLDGVPQVNGVDTYVLEPSAANPEYKKITVGDNRRAVDVAVGSITDMIYGNTVTIGDAYSLTDRTLGSPMPSTSYKVSLYLGNTEITPDVTGFDFTTLDAGMYTLNFELVGAFDTTHVLTNSSLPFEVKPVELTAPTLKDGVTLTFSGLDQNLADSLQNFDPEYMEFAINSIHEAYHAGTYAAIIDIKAQYAGNYVFVMPQSGATGTRVPVKGLVDDPVSNNVQLSNGNATAAIDWTINKYVYDTTQKSAWNFAKEGASLSFNGVPATIKALTMGENPSLVLNVAYFDLDGNPLTDVELKGGNKFKVAAYLDPSCADFNDIEFKGQSYDPLLSLTVSPQAAYTVPQSGAAAFMNNVKDFMTKTWMGLPIWAWFAIGLALLILLIIIIVVAVKRRKTKEEKEEIKARKEEERQRKEEEKQRREEEREAERQRREEERRMQQERLDAERELAKAKQEAELEKIRAQAQMGAGAGMAAMAMQQPMQAQQPMQQQMQQPMQQAQQPMQQSYREPADNGNNELLREMREQMAELRADNRATQAQLKEMQYNNRQQPMYQPQPMMYQQPAPAAAPAASSDLMTLMDLKVQMAEMKSAQAVAEIKAAQAIAEAKSANQSNNNNNQNQQAQQPVIVMAPNSPLGAMGAPYSSSYPNHGGYPSVNMGYGMQALPAPQQMMNPYGMTPPYGYPPYAAVPPYGYPMAMLPQPAYAPAKPASEEQEPVVTSTSSATPSMTMSQPPYCPPGAVMTTTTTIDTSKAGGKPQAIKRTAADSADDMNFDIDGFYDPLD